MADWAGLLDDFLIQIVERLTSIESYDSFAAVCKSWQKVTTEDHLKQIRSFEGPWLMLAEKEKDAREFFSLPSCKTRKFLLPEASQKRCLSCKDWLFVVAEDEIHASLLHPISRVQIHLPKLNTFPDYDHYVNDNLHFIEQVVLSRNPSLTSDFIVMVLWGGRRQLGFCRPGDTFWTATKDWIGAFSDIIYCDNKLYALDYQSGIVRCDVHEPNPTNLQLHQVFSISLQEIFSKFYLVEFSGKFLIVCRSVDLKEEEDEEEKEEYITTKFRVIEVNIEDGKWVEMKDFGNKALFVGYNSSFFVECSEVNNLKPNCIYFSDDNMEPYLAYSEMDGKDRGGKDMGIYHLSDGSIEPLFDYKIVFSSITPPTWIAPSSWLWKF